jgi:fatty acid desaturase
MGRARKPRKGLFCWLSICMKRSLFLNTPKDAWLVLQTLTVIALPLVTAAMSLDFIWWVVMLPIHFFILLNTLNSSMHHHTHWATFSNQKLNNIYELVVSASNMHSTQIYRKNHSTHHKHVNDIPIDGKSRDPVSVFGQGKNNQRENFYKFCSLRAVQILILPIRNLLGTCGIGSKPNLVFMKYTHWRNEQWASIALPVVIFMLDWVYGLWLLCVIYYLAHFFNYAWHYGEHYGAHHLRGDTTRDSVAIYNRWYNTFCFNSGYHQEHHHRPGTHWSRLKEVTAMLPADRVQVSGMHITNNPYWQDFKQLFVKPSSN